MHVFLQLSHSPDALLVLMHAYCISIALTGKVAGNKLLQVSVGVIQFG